MERPVKDLHDDMLKLVRYKVLFVRRDYEVAFPEEEDLISDNLTGDSFVAWKIAEFVQNLEKGETPVPARWRTKSYPSGHSEGDFLTGLPHEDKKYLRVYYEVLERYPREKFKYEEQQIRVLEEIRAELKPQAGVNDPYHDLLSDLQNSFSTFSSWRESFRRCAGPIGSQLAAILNEHAALGSVAMPTLSAEDITQALRGEGHAHEDLMDRFSLSGSSTLQVFIRQAGAPPADVDVPPNYSIRTKAIQHTTPGIIFIQKIGESYVQPVDPQNSSALNKALVSRQADLHVHAQFDDIGLVTWSSLNQGEPLHMRGIGYEVNRKILFFKQMLNADKTPLSGPMPSAPMVQVVKDQFVVAVEFLTDQPGRTGIAALPMNFNFDKCDAAFQGLVLKFTNAAGDQGKH